MLRRLVLPALLAFVTANTYAQTWGNQVTITAVQAQTNGEVFLTTSGNQNPSSCSSPSWLMINDTTYKFVVATLLAAQVSGQSVALYYNGCSGGGTTGYPLVTAIAVPNE
jgi:hypothetical protein